jgi:hypothetical protein
MTAAITKLTARTLIVAGVFAVVVAANYMRGVAGDTGITFATGGLNLKIDSAGWYNGAMIPSATWGMKNLTPGVDKFFNFDDIKPGDYGCEVISMHVNAPAWMCLDFKNLTQNENGVNEPESHEDGTAGPDLADGTEFFGWMDDGDGKYEPPNEKPIFGTSTQAASYVFASTTYAIADSRGNRCELNSKRYVGMCWCAGDLKVNSAGKFSCDATKLGNKAQTDSFSIDVQLRAQLAPEVPKFQCGGYPPVSPPCTACNGPLTVNVNNTGFINSTTTSSSNTGGNTAGNGGNVVTGNATSTASSTNTQNNTNVGGTGGTGGTSGTASTRDILDRLRNILRTR